MKRYEDTYWVVPTRLLREYRHGRLHAADALVMILLLNLPFSYFRHEDLRYWWGVSRARWFLILERLTRKGMISLHPSPKKGWCHIKVLPPFKLPTPIREQWLPVFPRHYFPKMSRVLSQYYNRLRWEFDQELKELSRSESGQEEESNSNAI